MTPVTGNVTIYSTSLKTDKRWTSVGPVILELPKVSGERRFFFSVTGKSYVKVLKTNGWRVNGDQAQEKCSKVAQDMNKAGFKIASHGFAAYALKGRLARYFNACYIAK